MSKVRPSPVQFGNVWRFQVFVEGIENPLLQSCRGLRSGMCVKIRSTCVSVSFVRYIDRCCVSEPDSNGYAGRRRNLVRNFWKARENAHVIGKGPSFAESRD